MAMEGESLVPRDLVLNTYSQTTPSRAGLIFISGGKIILDTGSGFETVTSAA